MEQYINTCRMDNFYTSAILYIENNPTFMHAFEKWRDVKVKEVIDLFAAGDNGIGHTVWMETLHDYEMVEWGKKSKVYQTLPVSKKVLKSRRN